MVTNERPRSQDGFAQRLRHSAHRRESWLCVGLDPDPNRLPQNLPQNARGIADFCRAIIDSTQNVAAAYKLNLAFFELLGAEGWSALEEVHNAVPADTPVIADAKRGDIGNTSRAYADSILGNLKFDALTVSPYLGWDALQPFLEYQLKGVIVLCKTSNPGASALQDLEVGGEPLYMRVARGALSLPSAADVGLVVGATQPEALRAVRRLNTDTILLVPGVGEQGGSAAQAVELGANAQGDNALINVSREILFASDGADYAARAARVARERASETWRGGARTG